MTHPSPSLGFRGKRAPSSIADAKKVTYRSAAPFHNFFLQSKQVERVYRTDVIIELPHITYVIIEKFLSRLEEGNDKWRYRYQGHWNGENWIMSLNVTDLNMSRSFSVRLRSNMSSTLRLSILMCTSYFVRFSLSSTFISSTL